jgi:hypothetical protein
MKRLLFVVCLLASSAGSSLAAQVVWEGELYLETVTPACATGDFRTGFFSSHFHAVFRPANLGDNGPDTFLSLITPRSAFQYTFPGQDFGNGTFSATGIGGTAKVFTWNTSKFTLASVKPAQLAPNTQTIVLKAKITNFLSNAACTVTVIAGLGLRPNLDQPVATTAP